VAKDEAATHGSALVPKIASAGIAPNPRSLTFRINSALGVIGDHESARLKRHINTLNERLIMDQKDWRIGIKLILWYSAEQPSV
jgi:hypothetical protein